MSSMDIEDLVPVGGSKLHGSAALAVQKISTSLLCWYDENKRKLPWRDQSTTPYGTWVSEIMLQQTRVETVINYYNKWMKLFPTVKDLAEATPDEVNSAWAGLGYYRRARNLHNGAKMVVEDFNGELPTDLKRLLKIPGIGSYTAGAIASIAFQQPEPVVDGNVCRVFARMCKSECQVKDKAFVKGCWKLAAELVPKRRPGDYNQALMELGAVVCTQKSPKCTQCPASSFCSAFAEDPSTVTNYPVKATKKTLPEHSFAVAVVSRFAKQGGRKRKLTENKEYLLQQRPKKGLLAGQWEFVALQMHSEEELKLPKRQESINNILGLCRTCVKSNKQNRSEVGSFTHTFTHLRHQYYIEKFHIESECSCFSVKSNNQMQWMSVEQMNAKGLTKATRKCLQLSEDTAGPSDTVTKTLKGKGKRKQQKK